MFLRVHSPLLEVNSFSRVPACPARDTISQPPVKDLCSSDQLPANRMEEEVTHSVSVSLTLDFLVKSGCVFNSRHSAVGSFIPARTLKLQGVRYSPDPKLGHHMLLLFDLLFWRDFFCRVVGLY